MNYILYFFLWTFILYWIHRVVHILPILNKIHWNHHRYINLNNTTWKFNNLFLFNDNWTSTLDLWITEVIPTLIFSSITGQWWIIVFYYLWAALLQESIEHNSKFDLPLLTSGRWHLIHHKTPNKNFGLFFSCWDILFKTYDLHKQR